MERDLLGRSRRACARLRERPARARRQQGRHLRAPRAQLGRVGAPRLRVRQDRCGRHSGVRVQLPSRHRLSPLPLGRGRHRLRRRRAAREGRSGRGGAPGAAARPHVPRPRRARSARQGLRAGESRRARQRDRSARRGRPVHDHLHVGDDRTAQGLHAPPPQLLRDGGLRRPPPRVLPAGRPDAPLSPARPQLRAADAAPRREGRLHDRVPRRPATRRRGAARGAPDAAPLGSARVREDLRDRPVPSLSGDGREETARRVGARGRPARRANGRREATPFPSGSARSVA